MNVKLVNEMKPFGKSKYQTKRFKILFVIVN